MERHLAQFYAEGGTPSSVIEMPDKLSREQAAIIRDTWEATHRRHRRPAVIGGGGKWRAVQTSASDQQMLEFKESLIRDIARVFRIPSHLIGASGDNQTYQNVEQASMNFLTHTVTPWLRRIELGLSKVLPEGTDVVFDYSSLLRPDALTRAKVAQIHTGIGSANPNEVRILEGWAPYEGGDVFHQALPGAITAGGLLPELGEDASNNGPVMGVLE
jgi:HK97 family phage portal protein